MAVVEAARHARAAVGPGRYAGAGDVQHELIVTEAADRAAEVTAARLHRHLRARAVPL